MEHPRNPMDLVEWRRIPELDRILRACGIDEAYITGGASDYDRFLALAEAMPLCEGHPVRGEVDRALWEATGLAISLCPHTASAFWETWTAIHWYGGEAPSLDLPAKCPLCGSAEPTILTAEQLTDLPNPWEIPTRDMREWTEILEASLAGGGQFPVVILPEDYAFARPDPYHVGEVLRLLAEGGTLTASQRDLLITQALRVWGQMSTRRGGKQTWQGTILLRRGQGGEVIRLLEYLQSAKALPEMVWLPQDPAEAGRISGLYACVGTGADLSACANNQQKQEKLASYAAVAPLGRAVILQ